MSKTAKQILERVYNKGFNDRCQQEKYADIDNQFVFALSVDQALKGIEAIIREAKPEKKDQQAQSTLEDESRCRFYRYGGYNFAIDEYEQTLIEALYGKEVEL